MLHAWATITPHFALVKYSGQQTGGGASTETFLHKKIFQCDREPKCTHVIQLDDSGEYVVVKTLWKR